MKKIVLAGVLIMVIVFLVLLNTRKVNEYWDNQEEIMYSDELNLQVFETHYLRGYLSFNQRYYLLDAKVDQSSIELWEVTELPLPFALRKAGNSDTVKIRTAESVFYILLDGR